MMTVSAIITTFNRANYLKLAIASVLSQSYSNFELIILDNSSSDHTEETVHSFDDSRIRYIKHQPLNISETRNLGVRESQGEFIAFLDDDDEWMPDKLEKELQLFLKVSKQVALVYGGFIRIDKNGRPFYAHVPKLKGQILKNLLSLKDDFTGSASNPMIRKSVIHQLGGFDEEIRTGEDWEFYLRLSEKYLIECVEEPIVKIRHHFGARLGDRVKDYIDLEMKVMQQFETVFNQDKKLHAFYLQRIAGKFIRLNQMAEGRRYLLQAIKQAPFNIVVYVQWFLSFMPIRFYKMAHKFYLNQKRPVKL